MSYVKKSCCTSCAHGGRCDSLGGLLPSAPQASATNLILLGLGVTFAYLVLAPKKKRRR